MSRVLVFCLSLTVFYALHAGAQSCSTDAGPQAQGDTLLYPKQQTSLPILNNDRGRDLRLEAVTTWDLAEANGDLLDSEDRKTVTFVPRTGQTQGKFTYRVREAESNVIVSALVVLVPSESTSTSPTIESRCDGPVCTFKLPTISTNGLKNVAWNFGHGPELTPWRGVSAAKIYPEPCDGCTARYNVEATVDYYDGRQIKVGPLKIEVQRKRATLAWDFVHGRTERFYWMLTYGARAQIRIASTETDCPSAWEFWIDWGDGSLEVLSEQTFGCVAPNTYGHVYAEDRSYTIGVYYREGHTDPIRRSLAEKHFWAQNGPPDPVIGIDDTTNPKKKIFRVAAVFDEYHPGEPNGPTRYEWDFDDGTFAVAPLTNGEPGPVEHTFVAPGTREVRLKITDHRGQVGVQRQSVTIPNTPPVASFAYRCAGHVCAFDGSGSFDDLGIAKYIWNLGGAIRETTEPSIVYTFGINGAFPVALTVEPYRMPDEGPVQSAPARRIVNATITPPAAAARYFALTPCRLFDSRDNWGAPLPSGAARAIAVAGRCGVPLNAADASVALGFAVVGPSGAGHLQVLGSPTTPTSSTVLNFAPDRSPRAGNTIVPIGSDGNVWAIPYVLGGTPSTHLVVDVHGYFASDSVAPAGAKGPLRFAVLDQPCRVFDSGTQPLVNPNIGYVKVRGAAGCGGAIPATISPSGGAAALNFVAAAATAPGHLLVFPSNAAWTSIDKTSALNVLPASSVANGALLSLGNRNADDVGFFYASNPGGGQTRYLVDATGYFSASAPLVYHAIQPCRAVDTRDPERGQRTLQSNVEEWFQMRGNCGVPMEAAAIAITATVAGATSAGHLKLYAAGTPTPQATFLNIPSNDPAISNSSIVRIAPGTEYIYDLAARLELPGAAPQSGALIVDVIGYFAPPPSTATTNSREEQ